MKSKFLTLLCSFLVLFSVNAHAFTLNDATSFDPIPVQVQAASIGVPVGTVIVWTREEIPEGWLECNGQAVPDIYPDLKVLMPNVPNYQGMFLRGAGSQSINHGSYGSVVHGTKLGEVQGDTIRETLEGTFEITDFGGIVFGAFTNTTGVFSAYGGSNNWKIRGDFGSAGQRTLKFSMKNAVPTSEENRPVNIGVKYLIKAE